VNFLTLQEHAPNPETRPHPRCSGASGFASGSIPTPGIPRTADGKPNLATPAPRALDGKPNLSGLWQVEPTPWPEMKPTVGNMNDVFAPGDDLMEFLKKPKLLRLIKVTALCAESPVVY
jgi:hypothetical protein